MDGSVRQSSRRAHPFFALVSLSFFSLIALFSRRAVHLHHVHYSRRDLQFPRADGDPPLSTTSSSNHTTLVAPLAGQLSPGPSTPSPSPSSNSSTSLLSTPITSSLTSTISTSTSTRTNSAPSPLPTSQSYISTPTTTTLTTSTAAIPASSSTTTYSSISDVTPSTTFDIGVNDPSTSTSVVPSVESSSTGTSSGTTSSSTKFWDNKGAVAATFVFTSLLALAFIIMIIMTILKRRKAREEALIDAEFMPNSQEPNSPVGSLTPSIGTSPLDPFRSHDVVHDHVPTDIPAPSKPTNSFIPTIQLTPASAFFGPSSYLLPSQLQPPPINAAGQRNKSEIRGSTQSGYQRSFDSFYGAYD